MARLFNCRHTEDTEHFRKGRTQGRPLAQASACIFKGSLGTFCRPLELEAVAKLRSNVMDYVANLLEVCGSLIQLFEFQRTDVIWNAHHRKLMGFLGQK